jgi:hypothetical protein
MRKRQVKRITRDLTQAEKRRLQKYREQIGQELPDFQGRDQMRMDARDPFSRCVGFTNQGHIPD